MQLDLRLHINHRMSSQWLHFLPLSFRKVNRQTLELNDPIDQVDIIDINHNIVIFGDFKAPLSILYSRGTLEIKRTFYRTLY